MSAESVHTDGNEVAGLMQEIFLVEMTAAQRICQSCGAQRALGAHRAFHGPGVVLRCPQCGDLGGCITALPDRHVVELRGRWIFDHAPTGASS